LAKHLVANGHDVTALSRRDCAAATRSITIDLTTDESPRVIEKLAAATGAPDVVVHAASKQAGPGALIDFVNANVHSTSNLIEGLTQKPPRLIIYTSTQSVYGRPSLIPVDEASPAGGTLPYRASTAPISRMVFSPAWHALHYATNRSNSTHAVNWSGMRFTSATSCEQ
jgi:nucleoside-diphosphate-sugar epimerase